MDSCQRTWIEVEITEIEEQSLEVFCQKGVLRNFTKFTGKHPCQSLFFNNVAGLRPDNNFLTEHLRTTASGKRSPLKAGVLNIFG